MFTFCSCSTSDDSRSLKKSTQTTENIENNEDAPEYKYIGDYEQEPVYNKLKQIETCKDPETLCKILNELYGETFTYIKMEYRENGYASPYNDFICTAIPLYNAYLCRAPITTDTYLFFEPYSEEPSFVMDCDGTYIVSKYEIKNFDDGTHAHSVSSWIITDLFMCLHGYIDEDTEGKNLLRDSVRYMDYYLEFENLVVDKLETDSGNTNNTDGLKASIDILSLDITGPTMHELNVKYQIKNVSDKQGVVYLTCSGHAYQGELHFNDENFKNDYRENGCFDYDIYYGGNEKPVTFTIFYGYGKFDPYKGWDNECKTTITLLFTEDYGKISSNTISQDEIYPLYFDGKYVGAWTKHESKDLIEIDGNSKSIPFSKNNTFHSQTGDVVTVKLSNGKPLFTVNGIYIGAPSDTYEHNGVVYYNLNYDDYFSINRYPNDEYIRVQNAWALMSDGDISLYP